MKVPLRYQVTDFDCGPTALINAVSFLFDCETIPPDIPKKIIDICNDEPDGEGHYGRRGTTSAAMAYTAGWFNAYAAATGFPVRCTYLSGEAVDLSPGQPLRQCLEEGGAAVVHCRLNEGHYITLTGLRGESVLFFDPYYREGPRDGEEAEFVFDQPKTHNRRCSIQRMNTAETAYGTMCQHESRTAVLFYRTGDPPELDP